MQNSILLYISLIIVILFFVLLAERLKVAYPIILVIGGLVLSLIPMIPNIVIDPELIFVIFLSPLLYEAAWYTSWKELWRWRRVISSFAFFIVIVTSLVIAVISSKLLPGFTLAMGFLLGGIVSPPDAVSATTVLKYVKIPKRVSAILEGESLLNDAASLIVFRFALIAVDTGRFVFHEAAVNFVLVIVMGIVIGVAIAGCYFLFHRWLPTSPNMDVVLTLTAPYVMYIAAESFHFSGVLAVVSGGLFLSARRHIILSHQSRLRGENVWSTLGFVLNGLVFMLIGLELPLIIQELGTTSLLQAILYGVIITLALIVTRLLSTLGASVFTVFISRYITTADSRPGWKGPMILGWAGMRGVVSLAAALSIPLHIPQRNLILFITFMVILLTLVVQGLTLPWVVKKVNMEDPDNMPAPEQQDISIRQQLAAKSLEWMDSRPPELLASNSPLRQLRKKFSEEAIEPDEEMLSTRKEFREAYLTLLNEQRNFLHDLNEQPDIDEDIVRKHLGLLDIEEEKIRLRYEND